MPSYYTDTIAYFGYNLRLPSDDILAAGLHYYYPVRKITDWATKGCPCGEKRRHKHDAFDRVHSVG